MTENIINADVALLIPGLLNDDFQLRSLEKHPSINRIVAAASKSLVKTAGLESAVLKWFHGASVPVQNCAAMLGFSMDFPNAAGDKFYLRCDPVFQQLDINEALLADRSIVDVQEAEASALVKDLNSHFVHDGVRFYCAQPSRWYCEFPRSLNISTLPPSLATGKSVSLTSVQGADAGVWRGWLAEIEMLLFAHEVNQSRAASGKAAINSLWLWGEGDAQQLSSTIRSRDGVLVFSDEFYVRSLCNHHSVDCETLENVHFNVTDSAVMLADDRLVSAVTTGDSTRYERVLRTMENTIFTKLEKHLKNNPSLNCVIWGGGDCWLSFSAPATFKRVVEFFSGVLMRRSDVHGAV